MYDEILENLKKYATFRERKLRYKGLVTLSLRRTGYAKDINPTYPLSITFDTPADLWKLMQAGAGYERTWRDALDEKKHPENKHLQGTDYNDKQALEQSKQIELGYEPRMAEDIKAFQALPVDEQFNKI